MYDYGHTNGRQRAARGIRYPHEERIVQIADYGASFPRHTHMYIHRHSHSHKNSHPRSRWSLASTQERKRTRLNPAVYIWKCAPSLLPALLSPVFVTPGIADGRNRNVKFFDPSHDASIFRSRPRHAPRPLSRKKSRISVDQGYMGCPLDNFGILRFGSNCQSCQKKVVELVIFSSVILLLPKIHRS